MAMITASAAVASDSLRTELASVLAEFPGWHGFLSDQGWMYAVRTTHSSGLTAFGCTGERLKQSIAEAEHIRECAMRRAGAAA
jgi:hypothetical protein